MKKRAAVIGGGISGLTAAYRLRRAGVETVLFEKNTAVGGNIRSEVREGFLIEHGPSSTLTSVDLLGLIEDLGITQRIARPKKTSSKRYILRDGALQALPMDPVSLLTTKVFSGASKVGLLKEAFLKNNGPQNESVYDFFVRRFGTEIVDYAVDPFVSGIYAGDPQKLSIKYAFPKLFKAEKEHGSVIKGMLFGKKDPGPKMPKGSPHSLSFDGGMQVLPDTLEKELGDSIRKNTSVNFIKRSENGKVDIGTDSGAEQFDSLVISMPAHPAAQAISELDPVLSAALSELYYPPIVVVYTGFRQQDVERAPDGFGFLVPKVEGRKILGNLWTSSIYEGRAPEGHYLFTTYVGGSRNPDLCSGTDEQIMSSVLGETDSMMGLKGEPVFTGMTRWSKAIPQYNIGYEAVAEGINTFREKYPEIFFCNNFYKGISVNECVVNGNAVAREVAEFLK